MRKDQKLESSRYWKCLKKLLNKKMNLFKGVQEVETLKNTIMVGFAYVLAFTVSSFLIQCMPSKNLKKLQK